MGDKRIKSKAGKELLQNIRKICKKLPEIKEAVDEFGHTSFRINDKPIVILGEYGKPSVSVKADKSMQEVLIESGAYSKTPYIGQHGWVSAEDKFDFKQLEGLIVEAFMRTAPKRLLKQFEA